MSDTEVARLREEIAGVDREIVALVARRLYLAEQIGLEKRLGAQPIRVTEVEAQVASRMETEARQRGLEPALADSLSRLLIEEGVRRQESIVLPDPARGTALVIGGAGRMGRWLSRYLRFQGYQVIVHDVAGPRVNLPGSAATADLIAVAVPMDAAASVLDTVAAAEPTGLVFDIASLKTPVARSLRSLARAGGPVASIHPLFGPHFGPLSQGTILICDCGSAAGVETVRGLFRASGAHLVDVPLEDHDEMMATVLGLSHLTLLAFARAAARAPVDASLIPTEGTTFARLTAVARGLLEDSSTLLREVQSMNPHTPDVRRRLLEAIDEWTHAASDSDGKSFDTLLQGTRNVGGASHE